VRKKTILTAIVLTFVFVTTAYAANVFTETFNSITPGTAISTSNTSFDYVRIGSGGGSITAEDTAGGETHMRLGGASGGSLNGVGLGSGLGNLNVTTTNFRISLEDTSGDIVITMGSGSTFSNNSGFNTSELMWGIQSDSGNLEYRTSSWQNIGQTLSTNTNYEFHIVANRSGATINYGIYSVADGTMDLFMNGSLIGDDLAIADNQNANGFRFYQVNGSSYARIDSITIDNTALEPFVPTAVSLQSFTGVSNTIPILILATILILLLGGTIFIWQRKR